MQKVSYDEGRPIRKTNRKESVAKLKKKADKYYSLATRYRHSFQRNGETVSSCITCGTVKNIKDLQAGHFVSRKVNVLRYDDENVAPQCYSCNIMQYGERYEFAKQIDLMYGNGKADELHSRRHESHKFTVDELNQIIEDCKTEIAFYEN